MLERVWSQSWFLGFGRGFLLFLVSLIARHRIEGGGIGHFAGGAAGGGGFAASGLGWLLPALLPTGAWGVAAFAAMLVLGGVGGVLIFINFLALRQAVTPAPLLGRMTATMRWLILLPAAPGALLGGLIAERISLSATLGAAGLMSWVVVVLAWRWSVIRRVRALPSLPSQQPSVSAG